jgi:molybdopterin-containing oxidoreductase family iron-sulfur binding subunit
MNARKTDDVAARFWRSVEAYQQAQPEGLGRRRFLQLMGSAVAIPSLAACTRQPEEKIVPFVRAPEDVVAGRPKFYASAVELAGLATGVLVETHMGRPTKVEGNPEHPASMGGTDAIAQAEILRMYDPDRSQSVQHDGAVSSWAAFVSALRVHVAARRSKKGEGLHIVTGAISSPTLRAQLEALLDDMPEAMWHVHEPSANDYAAHHGTRGTFGEALDARYHFDQSDVVLSLDADFLGSAEGNPRYVRDLTDRRREDLDAREGVPAHRIYALESTPGLVGAMADHRVGLRASDIEHVARFIAAELLGDKATKLLDGAKLPAAVSQAWIQTVARDLKDAGEYGVVVPGKYQPPVIHRIAHIINAELEAIGKTVSFIEPVLHHERSKSMLDLVNALGNDRVELLVCVDTNPMYDSPLVAGQFAKAKTRVHLGLYFDETAAQSHWHIPATHAFEAWGDTRSYDGTIAFVQPMIEPLYGGKSASELLAAFSDKPERTSHQIVRGHWEAQFQPGRFEHTWRRSLHDGVMAGSMGRSKKVELDSAASAFSPVAARESGMELTVRPAPTVHDGRHANNAWLQELPQPLTKLVWDNAVYLSPATAKTLGLATGDVVELEVAGYSAVEAPVWVLAGQPDESLHVQLGYGRTQAGNVGTGVGFAASSFSYTGKWIHDGLKVKKTGKRHQLVAAQTTHRQDADDTQRDLVRDGRLADYLADQNHFDNRAGHEPTSGSSGHQHNGYSWGMSIDLASCTGCSACVVACQAENNIPVVGKEQVRIGRQMHWLRVDRYYTGPPQAPTTVFQPVPCMHCEVAPCEVVCPVQATVHHDEGLNDMVYNRCVGAQNCSENCPYKVRRFNFFGYSIEPIAPLDPTKPSVRLSRNPDVTVRSNGVMEKCTYCVQRINFARVEAKKEDRKIRDGEVMTACQSACPARAISFGDISNRNSDVSKRKAEPRNYALLAELNTKPRTTYLARLSNPNTALTPTKPEEEPQ